MKKFRIILIVVIILIAAVLSLNIIARQQFARSVDDPSGTVIINGLVEDVVIKRDSLGVPCIEAKNEPDLYFATGYASASDRLWQMTLMNMAMQGRLAELFGKDYLKIDLFMRSLNVAETVDATLRNIDPATAAMLESFARGVNAYVASHPHLPAEFFLAGYRPGPWQPRDSLFVFAMLSLNLSFNFIEELDFLNIAARVGYEKAAWLFPVYPDEDLPFVEAAKLSELAPRGLNRTAEGWGELRDRLRTLLSIGLPASNNWAVAGSKTKSGRPIVCNDTHLALMIPNVWFMIHQKCPAFEAAGVTPPGIPIVALGFNGHVAWGATMVMADSQDIFIEKLSTINGVTHYLHRGQWLPARLRTETFRIKGEKPVVMAIKHTVHGPLLNEALAGMPVPPEMPVQPMPMKSDYGIALSWGQGDGNKTLGGFMALSRAKNVIEARQALCNIESIFLNIVYGDDRSIGWQVTGALPRRLKGSGFLPSPGWTGEYDWNGFLPVTANPHAEDPAEGFIATANNRTVPKDYPVRITSSWYNPERVERIRQVLATKKNITGRDMEKLQFDRYSLMAKKIQDVLFAGESAARVRAAIKAMDEERAEDALEALEFLKPGRFNAVMSPESSSAAVLGAFMHASIRAIFLDELGPEGSIPWESFQDAAIMSYSAQQDHILGREDSPYWDNIATPKKETRWDVLAGALADAVNLCEDRLGGDRADWQWGTLHTYHWRHDFTKELPVFHSYFNRGPYPAGGDGHTVNVSLPEWGTSFDVVEIPAMRLVVDFGLTEPARLIGTHGQSGNPSSPHYDDMLPLWLNGGNHPLPFGANAVKAQYSHVLVLKPGAKKSL
jgi:acyl-homoserine-lactone acylase